ncbi:hypothetical protein LZ659_19875, partial [Shewanella indica]|uniref:hypothetical protein n=1 Tax=Shewanella indica TaxID=768528 RepID=UPI001F242237
NIYLTYFMKFGFSSIFIFSYIFYVLNRVVCNKKYSKYISLYILLAGVTTAFTYQSIFAFLLIFPVLILKMQNYDDNFPTYTK